MIFQLNFSALSPILGVSSLNSGHLEPNIQYLKSFLSYIYTGSRNFVKSCISGPKFQFLPKH